MMNGTAKNPIMYPVVVGDNGPHIRINSNKLPIVRLLPKNMLTSTTANVCNVNGTGKN